jgi:hypothetical protein
MGHFLRTAVEVVGIAVAIAAAIPSGGTSLLAAGLGVTASTASLIAVGTEVAVAGFEAITAKKPTSLANPMDWQSNPEAGIPHIAGRMYFGGQIVYRQTFGKDNVNETINTVYSTGPIKGFEGYYVSGVLAAIDAGGHPAITDGEKVYVATQLGAQPEAAALGGTNNPGITPASKISGRAASTQTFSYDTKGGSTLTTEPQTGFVILGTPVYDPRKDSTYPGGNGPQRWNDETTWSFTGYDNPGLKALSYLIGYRNNGIVVIGVGLPFSSIIASQLVEMANVCDANGWTMAGVIFSTDQKWGIYSQILQAGGGTPLHTGALTGCLVNTPKVSLATFEIDDILGDWSVQGSQSRRARINSVVPRYMAEQSIVNETTDSHGNVTLQTVVTWGMATAGKIVVPDYVTEDGGERQKGIDYPFVTGVSTNDNAPNQVAQLARYDIENAREFGPVKINMKPRWMGYRAGDVITGGASLHELGLVGQDIMLLNRQFNPSNYTVSMTARSETAAKHAFALGQTTTAPPTPMLSGPPLIPVPSANSWAIVSETVSANGTTIPALVIQGATDSSVISGVVFEYRESTGQQDDGADWISAGINAPGAETKAITGVKDGTEYQCAVSYQTVSGTGSRLILGPVVAGQTSVPWESGVTGPGKPEDGATVGAPDGTPVGDRNAQDVTASLDLNAQGIIEQGLRQDDAQTVLDARTFVAGQPINTVFETFQNTQIDQNNLVNSSLALLGGKSPDGTAWDLALDTVRIGPSETLAQRFTEIGATNGTLTATVESLQEAVVGADGSATARAVLSLDVNGFVSGFVTTNNGTNSSFDILATHFSIVDPNSGTPYTVFDITDGIVTMHNVQVDTLAAGSVTIDGIATGLTNVVSFNADDVMIDSSETTLIETDAFMLGDSIAGNGMATITFLQDSLTVRDTFVRFRVYVDYGDGHGYINKRDRIEGIQTASGNTYWAKSVSFPLLIVATSPVKIKVTGTGVQVNGGGVTSGSYARNIEIDVLKLGR